MDKRFIKLTTLSGFLFFLLAVALGAFAAHGLKGHISGKYLQTFQTGVTYQFYHSIALVLLAPLAHTFQKEFRISYFFYLLGIIFFSLNCYLYALTTYKMFAMLVPIGGISFMIGHMSSIYKIIKD